MISNVNGCPGLNKLTRLNLGWCGCLDDAELAHITALSGLTSLEVARTKVSSSVVAHFRLVSIMCCIAQRVVLPVAICGGICDNMQGTWMIACSTCPNH